MEYSGGGKPYPPKGGWSQDGTITKVGDGALTGTGDLDADKPRTPKPL